MSNQINIIITDKPVGVSEFDGIGTRDRHRYRVTEVTGTFSFINGEWSDVKWTASGFLIKKDDSLGHSPSLAPGKYEPDALTAVEFTKRAFAGLEQANKKMGGLSQ